MACLVLQKRREPASVEGHAVVLGVETFLRDDVADVLGLNLEHGRKLHVVEGVFFALATDVFAQVDRWLPHLQKTNSQIELPLNNVNSSNFIEKLL